MKRTFTILLLFFTTHLLGANKVPNVDNIFEKLLTEKGVSFKKVGGGLYRVDNNSLVKTISLKNIEKNYLRDGNVEAVQRFVENILQPIAELPDTAELRKGLFVTIEPSEYEGINETLNKKFSDKTVLVVAYYNERANQIRWLSASDLDRKKISIEKAWEEAYSNLEKIISTTAVNFTDIDGQKLGMIDTHEPYKASLILTKGLKNKVIKDIGWPIYAVTPARDFVYIFSKQSGLVNRVGKVVIDEYKKSGYPISTEVWELSDNSQKAIGEFPKN